MKTLSFLIFGFILACSNTSERSADHRSSEEHLAYEVIEESEMQQKSIQPPGDASLEIQEQKIIKTGNLRFATKNLEETHTKTLQLVNRYDGILQSDRSGKNYNEVFRDITIRIPYQHFQTVIDSLSKGVEYFDHKDITQQDVSEEFVDIQARLKAKRELENRYIELLKQAKNVKEMLEIERELATIREEIEARQGRLNYLQNQVSYSTIHLYFYKTSTDKGVTASYGQKMWNAVVSGWNGISLFFLGLLHIWPFFIILLIAIIGIRKYVKKKKGLK